LSYPGADIVVLCFSLVSMTSFDAIKEKWHREVDHYIPECPTLLVGTKVDLRDENKKDPGTGEYEPVSNEEGKAVAKEINASGYLEISAFKGTNLQKVYDK